MSRAKILSPGIKLCIVRVNIQHQQERQYSGSELALVGRDGVNKPSGELPVGSEEERAEAQFAAIEDDMGRPWLIIEPRRNKAHVINITNNNHWLSL